MVWTTSQAASAPHQVSAIDVGRLAMRVAGRWQTPDISTSSKSQPKTKNSAIMAADCATWRVRHVIKTARR
jgi:hypothetical protein